MTTARSQSYDANAEAIDQALRRIGEPVTETQVEALEREDCECKQGHVRAGRDPPRRCSAVPAWSPPSE